MEHVDVVTKKNKHKTKRQSAIFSAINLKKKKHTQHIEIESANTNTKQIKRHIKRKTKAEKIRQSVCFLVK